MFLRDVLMYKNHANIEEKLMYENEKFKSTSSIITKSVIYKWLDILSDALNQMKFTTQKRAYLELAILKISDTNVIQEANILDRLDSLEKTVEELYNRPQIVQQIEPKKEEKIFKTVEEINNIRNEVQNNNIEKMAQQEEKIEIPDNEISIHDVERILYSATKEHKEELQKIWNEISIKYADRVDIMMLTRGKIYAASEDSFIVGLMDIGFCNKIMKYESYLRIMEVINEYNPNIKDYICVTHDSWNKIARDYKEKYSYNNLRPELKEIRLGVKKRIIPQAQKSDDEILIDDAKSLLGENIEILEEK